MKTAGDIIVKKLDSMSQNKDGQTNETQKNDEQNILVSGNRTHAFMSGCVVSRTGEKAWSVGVIDYYADFSEIEGNVVYEKDGEYYIKAEEAGYKPDPT